MLVIDKPKPEPYFVNWNLVTIFDLLFGACAFSMIELHFYLQKNDKN